MICNTDLDQADHVSMHFLNIVSEFEKCNFSGDSFRFFNNGDISKTNFGTWTMIVIN